MRACTRLILSDLQSAFFSAYSTSLAQPKPVMHGEAECQVNKCRARGIDADAARQVLVYSFGAEVTQHLKHKQLIQRVQKVVASTLAKAPLLPADNK